MEELITDAPAVAANEFVLAKSMAETLHKHYPGHMWAVNVDAGIADVRNLALSGQWGFRVNLRSMYSASSFDKDIVRAGGELLERYRISRGRGGPEQAAHVPVDFAGRAAFDK